MKLSKAKTIELHRELWDWLAQNPDADKADWPGWSDYPQIPSLCFLCNYDKQGRCSVCPVQFKVPPELSPGTVNYCLGGVYHQWNHSTHPTNRALLAAVIRDLPIKFEVGDRVIPTSAYGNPNIPGKIGTVFETIPHFDGDILAGVEFDEYIDGHSGDNRKVGHCWYVESKYLSLIDEEAVPKSPDHHQNDLFTVRNVVMKLIGDIEPCGYVQIDEERHKNLNKLGDLITDLVLMLTEVATYRTWSEESVRQIGTLAYNSLVSIKTIIETKLSR